MLREREEEGREGWMGMVRGEEEGR